MEAWKRFFLFKTDYRLLIKSTSIPIRKILGQSCNGKIYHQPEKKVELTDKNSNFNKYHNEGSDIIIPLQKKAFKVLPNQANIIFKFKNIY